MTDWIYNPKTKGSGIITCIPQKGICPNQCADCFFQSGRSYLEPLDKNLPHIPSPELAKGRIVRINDGNDSNHQKELVIKTAQQYDDYFYNTAVRDLSGFDAPVVLTVNPGEMTDKDFHTVLPIPEHLMFVRIRVNTWNLDKVVDHAVEYYTAGDVPVVLTFMAYYTSTIPPLHQLHYEWKKRTINSYYVLRPESMALIEAMYKNNPLVYTCGVHGRHECKFCGNCVREYYNTKERMRQKKES